MYIGISANFKYKNYYFPLLPVQASPFEETYDFITISFTQRLLDHNYNKSKGDDKD